MTTARDTTAAISITGLVRDFGTTRALGHLDLTVLRGEVHASPGPNGAGRTTTARILLGLLRKTAGKATVVGIVGAAGIAATGLLPRWAGATTWVALMLSFLLGPLVGSTVGLQQWAQAISPLTHVPNAPATAIAATPVVALVANSAAPAAAGLTAFRRRNLALPT